MNYSTETTSQPSNNTVEQTVNISPFGKGLITFLFIWVFIGLVAFIMSLVCFARSGTTFDKIMGLLLAIFFGPFYFLFYVFNGGYCR
jgi:hypothetical protein